MESYKTVGYRKNTCIALILKQLKNKPKTTNELAKKLHRQPNTIRRYLCKLEKQRKIRRKAGKREFRKGRVKEIWITNKI